MKIILDENLPRDLALEFHEHETTTVNSMGWSGTQNGALLRVVEENSFKVFVTADRNLIYQQNIKASALIFVILHAKNTRLESLRPLIPEALQRLEFAQSGDILVISATLPDDP